MKDSVELMVCRGSRVFVGHLCGLSGTWLGHVKFSVGLMFTLSLRHQ